MPKFSSKALKTVLVIALGGLAVSLKTIAIAQPQSTTAQSGVAQPYPYSTNYSGRVETYLLNRQGLVDGLILSDGLQVKFPPHNANNLVATIKPGDSVTVTGTPGIPSNFGQEVRAYSITNTNTQRTVINQPPVHSPTPPTNVNPSNLSAEGNVRHWLVGRRGEIKGVLLSSGAQVMFPPQAGSQLLNLAKQGVTVRAQGFGTSNSYGQILRATSLIVDGQTIPIAYGPRRGRADRRAGKGLGRLSAYGPSPVPPIGPGPAYGPPPAGGQSTDGSTGPESSIRVDSSRGSVRGLW